MECVNMGLVALRIAKTRKINSQSAMEYLMTYGWAILIIAVVLGALFSLGVFNGNNFAPKASSGACQVFRPNGPGTTMDINLAGECQGLEPQYVAQFNGQSGYVTTTNSIQFYSNNLTFSTWVNIASYINSQSNQIIIGSALWGGDAHGWWLLGQGAIPSNNNRGWNAWSTYTTTSDSVANVGFGFYAMGPNTWQQIAFTRSASGNTAVVTAYVNGVMVGNNVQTNWQSWAQHTNWPFTIGGIAGGGWFFNGSIANVQIYNTSLSANEVQALYQEGIGGAPIDLQNIVGWWPLNGNANDYSGNNNNGQATNVIYTGSWTSSYSAP